MRKTLNFTFRFSIFFFQLFLLKNCTTHYLVFANTHLLKSNTVKLITHLRKERKIIVEKSSPGVYHINKETFDAQIIVTKELLPEQNLYLRCLTNSLQNSRLVNQLIDDYKLHQEQNIYIKYMHQLTIANSKPKGDSPMISEGTLNLCNIISADIIERTKKEDAEYYLPKINLLSSQNEYLKSLLKQNNIPFHLEAGMDNK